MSERNDEGGKKYSVIVAFGGQKKEFEVDSAGSVGDIQRLIATHLDVPGEQQKLLFKGKCLSDPTTLVATLAPKKNKVKITLIGSKESPEIIKCKKEFGMLQQEIDQTAIHLAKHEETWDNIIKGFLPLEHVDNDLRKLKQAVLGTNELNVRRLEQMDAMPITKEMTKLRSTRKVLIGVIEKLLSRGDDLISKIDSYDLLKRT